MAPEISSSHSRLASSHDASGYVIDANQGNAAAQPGYAVAVSEDDLGSDDAAEKQWRTKWKKRGIGFSFWRSVYGWKLEIFALTAMALIVVSEVRRLSLDRSSSASTFDSSTVLKLLFAFSVLTLAVSLLHQLKVDGPLPLNFTVSESGDLEKWRPEGRLQTVLEMMNLIINPDFGCV